MPLRTICLSHSPFIGLVSPGANIESDVRTKLSVLAEDVQDYKPDLIILIGPDHFNGFFYDLMPQFCVGARAEAVGDYNTPAGPIATSEDLAVAFVEAMGRENFDVAISYKMQVDHAFAQPLTALTGSLQKYPVLPLFINATAPPRPLWARTREFGAALGRFAAASGKRVLIVGTGGLSHDPPVPVIKDASPEVAHALTGGGRNLAPEARKIRQERTLKAGEDFAARKGNLRDLNDDWDRAFLAVLESGKLETFDSYTDDDVTQKAGRAAHEVRTWVAAFAAQSAAGPYQMEVLYQRPIPAWIVGMAMARAVAA
jgi:2,3-dihydroxyphenylpropionate 1,2-dioxygenase